MSLRDTINGARQEAQDAGTIPAGKNGGAAAADGQDSTAEESAGFSKKSISRARPAREAASGVRVVSTTGSTVSGGKSEASMTKEEKKAHRQQRRDREDRRAAASQIILKASDEYRRGYRLWWILLGIAVGVTVVSWLLVYYFPDQSSDYQTPIGIIALGTMIIAYACIITAFVYDWRKVRPLRKNADAIVSGMTEKRVNEILEDNIKEEARIEAEKAAAKQAKRDSRAQRHEQHK